jgi:predicted RecB family nuclease
MPTAQVTEDPDNPGDLFLDLGTELCARLDWQAGDILVWIDQKDGSWLLQKQPLTNYSNNSAQKV